MHRTRSTVQTFGRVAESKNWARGGFLSGGKKKKVTVFGSRKDEVEPVGSRIERDDRGEKLRSGLEKVHRKPIGTMRAAADKSGSNT